MKNEEIIARAAVAAGLISQEAADATLAAGGEIALHTPQGWSSRGYKVREGEEGIEVRLWKKKQERDAEHPFYLAKAFLFGEKQVEKI